MYMTFIGLFIGKQRNVAVDSRAGTNAQKGIFDIICEYIDLLFD